MVNLVNSSICTSFLYVASLTYDFRFFSLLSIFTYFDKFLIENLYLIQKALSQTGILLFKSEVLLTTH